MEGPKLWTKPKAVPRSWKCLGPIVLLMYSCSPHLDRGEERDAASARSIPKLHVDGPWRKEDLPRSKYRLSEYAGWTRIGLQTEASKLRESLHLSFKASDGLDHVFGPRKP